MSRISSHIWDTDIRPRLDRAAQRHPDGRVWLTLLAETLRELEADAWGAVVPQPRADGPGGAPLLAGITLAVDPSMARGWLRRLLRPAAKLTGPGTALLAAIDARRFDPLPLFEAAMCQDETRLASLAETGGADPQALGALMQLATMPLLHACGRHLAQRVRGDWPYGYCPVCGAWPTVAEVRGLERAHRWRCGRCGTDWGLALLRCPYCGEIDHLHLGSLVAEDETGSCAVHTCKTCNGYIKAVITLQAIPPSAVVLEDLATVEWDVVALERGYTRPAQPGYRLGLRVVRPPSRLGAFFNRLA